LQQGPARQRPRIARTARRLRWPSCGPCFERKRRYDRRQWNPPCLNADMDPVTRIETKVVPALGLAVGWSRPNVICVPSALVYSLLLGLVVARCASGSPRSARTSPPWRTT
jgi:hypothetical protein